MNTDLMFSSQTDLWETPQDLFDELNAEFHFNLDVCATDENAKCTNYYTKEQNALEQDWSSRICWMNPPYGRTIALWVKKAYDSMRKGGATVVCLLPSRTDTAWWHDYCMKGEIRFLRGRLKFSGNKYNAPFPSAIVIFRKEAKP